MTQTNVHSLEIPADQAGQRLDLTLARLFPQFSRTRLKQWIEDGSVRVDGALASPKSRVLGGEQVEVRESLAPRIVDQPEDIALSIVYEDEDLMIVDKPVGLVVHPGAGNASGTLVNALLHHDPSLDALPRAGLVHRLDKDTSGLLLIARSAPVQQSLIDMLSERRISREYQAVCRGVLTAGGTIDEPIDRHPVDRKKMAVRSEGRNAVTHYRIIERFRANTQVKVKLETGRTHQIRVHFAHLGNPLIGDAVYGGRLAIPAGAAESLADLLRRFRRQALHAWRLSLNHPVSGAEMSWTSEPPADFAALLDALRKDQEAVDGRT